MLGTTIAHYRVLELLGEGGMGQVFLVEDLKLQRRAALKLISPTLTQDETRLQRFVQEARLAASIDHPHIAAIYDIGEVDSRTYIAMEYVDGGSLREVLKAGPLKLPQALDYALQAGDALAKVHGRSVVHRDLKPENLLIAKDGYLKIIDFGLAKLTDPLGHNDVADAATMADARVRTAEGVVMGTMGYMSPEQVRGDTVDARSDIFSFGAVLYEMVTGVAPFRKRSAAETISAILGEMPATPRVEDATIGAELQRLLRKCLAKEPDNRYQGMRDLVVDLRQLRDSITSSETTSRPVEPAPRSAIGWWRRPPVWIGGAVIAVAIAAATLWSIRRGGEAPATTLNEAPVRPSVAVVPFEVIGGSPDVAWLAKGLPSMLITGLAQTPDLEVVGYERLGDAARQVGASTVDAVERSQLADLVRRAGARFIVNGTIVQAGADLRIDARVEDLSTGAVRLAETVRGPDPLALADDLSARVRRGLNVQTAPGAVRRVADVASASVEAYRAFTDGVEARSNERNADARRLFEEAVRVDPEFALAYVHLAEVDRHEVRISESRRWLGMAAQRLKRMPERDAVLVRAELARDAGRLDEADRLLEGLVARYPDTEQAWYNLAVSLWDVDHARTMAFLARAVAALPYSPGMQNLYGYAQMNTGRLEDAVRTFETYVKLRPSEPNALDSLAEGHLVAGHIPEALANYEAAIKGGFDSHRGKAWTLGVLGRYQEALAEASIQFQQLNLQSASTTRAFLLSRVGRYREALQAVDASQKKAEEDGFTEGVVASHLARALFALEQRDCAGVTRHLGAAEQMTKGIPALLAVRWQVLGDLLAGACDGGESRLDTAKRRLAHAQSVYRSTSLLERWWVNALEGEVALAERDFEKAGRAFAAGEPARKMFYQNGGIFAWLTFYGNNLVLRDGRARVAAAQGRGAEAIALYRGLLTPGPEQKWTAMFDPRHVIALARLLDKAGERDAARGEYQRFLDLWKDADRELPELAEARARLAR